MSDKKVIAELEADNQKMKETIKKLEEDLKRAEEENKKYIGIEREVKEQQQIIGDLANQEHIDDCKADAKQDAIDELKKLYEEWTCPETLAKEYTHNDTIAEALGELWDRLGQ